MEYLMLQFSLSTIVKLLKGRHTVYLVQSAVSCMHKDPLAPTPYFAGKFFDRTHFHQRRPAAPACNFLPYEVDILLGEPRYIP